MPLRCVVLRGRCSSERGAAGFDRVASQRGVWPQGRSGGVSVQDWGGGRGREGPDAGYCLWEGKEGKGEREREEDQGDPHPVVNHTHTHTYTPTYLQTRRSSSIAKPPPASASASASSPHSKTLPSSSTLFSPPIKNLKTQPPLFKLTKTPSKKAATALKLKSTSATSTATHTHTHTLARVKSNGFYDENWASKQQRSFTEWLNYTFRPTEENDQQSDDMNKFFTSDGSNNNNNNTNDNTTPADTALRALIVHRRNAAALVESTSAYHSYQFATLSTAIEAAVDGGKLAVRTDRDMYADLGLRQQITSLLMGYDGEVSTMRTL